MRILQPGPERHCSYGKKSVLFFRFCPSWQNVHNSTNSDSAAVSATATTQQVQIHS